MLLTTYLGIGENRKIRII